MNLAVRLDDVSFSYTHQEPVLQHVTLEIASGEFIGVIGPNGGGKTTLLKLILGFLKPTSGQVSVFGHPPTERQHPLAYVPQTQRFDRQFPISVIEVVLTGRLSHLPWFGRFNAEDKEIAQQCLEQVHLGDLSAQSFGTLSGGQAQRVLIARALAAKPQMILLDEPTASVDNRAEGEIFDILLSLKKQVTLVMVTHDLTSAIAQVDRVICVQRQAVSLLPDEVCGHYAIGLYHPPLMQRSGREPTA